MIESLYRASWQGAIAIIAVWLICRCASRLPASLRCWLWRLVYIRLLLALVLPSALSLAVLPPATPTDRAASSESTPYHRTGIAGTPAAPPIAPRFATEEVAPATESGTVVAITPRLGLTILYLLGVTLFAIRTGRAGWRAQRLLRDAHPIEHASCRSTAAASAAASLRW